VSLPVRTRSLFLALCAALALAALPAEARAATGGASPDGAAAGAVVPAATPKRTGGAAPAALRRTRRRRHARKRKPARVVSAPAPAPAPVGASASPPSATATLLTDGTVVAPAGAPAAVVAAIAAANRIAVLPYRWGGGHATWEDSGYDCSGSVGYALHGAGLLAASATSGELMSYGEPGPGTWITIYANPDHVYMVVAGLRFDTSGAKPSRWQATPRSGDGFVVRHPAGF